MSPPLRSHSSVASGRPAYGPGCGVCRKPSIATGCRPRLAIAESARAKPRICRSGHRGVASTSNWHAGNRHDEPSGIAHRSRATRLSAICESVILHIQPATPSLAYVVANGWAARLEAQFGVVHTGGAPPEGHRHPQKPDSAVGSDDVCSQTRRLAVGAPHRHIVQVVEQYGCDLGIWGRSPLLASPRSLLTTPMNSCCSKEPEPWRPLPLPCRWRGLGSPGWLGIVALVKCPLNSEEPDTVDQ